MTNEVEKYDPDNPFGKYADKVPKIRAALARGEQAWLCEPGKPVIKILGIAGDDLTVPQLPEPKPQYKHIEDIICAQPDDLYNEPVTGANRKMSHTDRPFTTIGDSVESTPLLPVENNPPPSPPPPPPPVPAKDDE